ncbi:mucin-13, partial [Nematolebias whitei]|uniref:mucin-13 n=1 Tax=Nematolebias whitei TaxID=451745 RepID=UPI001899AE9F
MAKQFTLLAAFLIVLAIGAGAEESVLSGEGDTVPSAASAGPGTSAASAGSSATEHSGATKDPDGPSTATVLPPTEVPATTQPPNPCDSNPCGSGSTCEARANQTFVCLCLPGDFYVILTQSCLKAQVFPGTLALTTMDYDEKMADKTTKEFQET